MGEFGEKEERDEKENENTELDGSILYVNQTNMYGVAVAEWVSLGKEEERKRRVRDEKVNERTILLLSLMAPSLTRPVALPSNTAEWVSLEN